MELKDSEALLETAKCLQYDDSTLSQAIDHFHDAVKTAMDKKDDKQLVAAMTALLEFKESHDFLSGDRFFKRINDIFHMGFERLESTPLCPELYQVAENT